MTIHAGDGNVILDSVGEIHIEGGIHVQNFLQQLEEVDEATKFRIQQGFEELIRNQPEQAQYSLALGLTYLDLGLYDQCREALEKALRKSPGDPQVLYFQAVALVRGRSLGSLRLNDAKEIDQLLTAAMARDPSKGIYPYFLALLKKKYFRKHGMREGRPAAQELILQARSRGVNEHSLKHLHKHVPVRPLRL